MNIAPPISCLIKLLSLPSKACLISFGFHSSCLEPESVGKEKYLIFMNLEGWHFLISFLIQGLLVCIVFVCVCLNSSLLTANEYIR